MRLKTLEIKGFKSFANETIVNFNKDVIGVVGPNGAGKSNIVDAIRWVLGEQKSKELRLDKMTSVIFNGTKKRKQAPVASVSLTFENTKNLLPTEYHVVTITRMLFRSGDSEYRLNNVPCRLRDITSLFLDTGIGSNSYAIIALGMVDDILQDKENARRRMFEQAAGISKYKKRKKETMSKLKSTTADLERIEDLLFEIDGQLKTLEKQAKRAKRYFELKEEYKTLAIGLATSKVKTFRDKHKTIQTQLTEEEDKYRQHEIDTHNLEGALERERKANVDKEQALSERQRQLNSLTGRIRGQENDKRMMLQKIQFNASNKSKLSEQIKNAEYRIGQLTGDIESFRENLTEDKRLEVELEDKLTEVEDRLKAIRSNHGTLKSDLDEVVKRQQTVERAVFELEKEKAINSNQLEGLQRETVRSDDESKSRQAEMDTLRSDVEKAEKDEEFQVKVLEKRQSEEEERRVSIEVTEKELDEATKKLQKANRSLDSKRNEYKLTKSMVESMEGFPESIQFLSNKKNWKNQALLLSDLIYVQEDYRVAIENYLDPYLNYYVVGNLEEAFMAIQLLTKAQKGKANFFLLDAFKDYTPPMTMVPDTQQAFDLIETEDQYRQLVSYLLENVLVTPKTDIAGKLERDDITLLSQSGRFIQRKYSVGGGSVGLFEGKKIGRKKNLEILEITINKTEKEVNKLQTDFHNLKGKIKDLKSKDTRNEIRMLQQQLNHVSQTKAGFVARLDNFENFIREAEGKSKETYERIKELKAANEEIEGFLRQKKHELELAREKILNTDGFFSDVAEKLSQASSAFNESNIEFIKQQNKVSSIQRELAFREKQAEETQAGLSRDMKVLSEGDSEMDGINEEIEHIEKALLVGYEEKKVLAANLTEAEQTYFKARGGINKIEDLIRKTNRERTDSQILVNQLKERLNDVRYQLQSIGERMRIEFNVSINDLLNQKESDEAKEDDGKKKGARIAVNEQEVQLKVERIKNRLDNYGEINPMAVQAYDEMSERFVSIKTQRDDITKAKDDLMTTIKEIEETATAQFIEAFEKARLYFIDVFRSLFSAEDNCDLILLDPDNPLESKIEIVAKPKGKRPQSISQLSGGEKTLTATALLFALYLLKPAPFCIFDEVDAPLDDANIEKFNKIIKKFSKDSQFIIVTHNKATMAAVDIIYGVYMQEPGVSSVTAVDFGKFENSGIFEPLSQN
jgi:chromosome segregation protein